VSPPTISEIETDCEADGHDCSGQIVVTKAVAICIAKDAGMADGIEQRYADLHYLSRFNAPVWSVSNVRASSDDGESSGDTVSINAIDGAVLEQSRWSMMP
jgi:hypothetical protein